MAEIGERPEFLSVRFVRAVYATSFLITIGRGCELRGRFLITYKQRFMDVILEGAYVKTVNNIGELYQAIESLYDDPHVFSVDYKELKDDE